MIIFVHIKNKKTISFMENSKHIYRNRLRVILAEKEKTNRWLAEKLDVSEITMSRWTTNKIQPSMSQFVIISKILEVDLNELIEDTLSYR